MLDQVPGVTTILLERGASQLSRDSRMRRIDRCVRFSSAQRTHDPFPHFGRSLASKCQRDNPLGPLDACKQGQEALDQQFGLPRTRRRLHEKGSRYVQRVAARSAIFRSECIG